MTESTGMHFNTILIFGIILICGFLAGKIANFFKLPKITGYITAGVVLAPSFSGILPGNFINASGSISNFALCIITYAIGGSLCFKRIRKLGKTILWMTVLEAETAFIMVFAGLFLLLPVISAHTGMGLAKESILPLALLIGALASPTDPTAALAIKEEYKAEGEVTTTILGIAALDDATGIINFSIATSIALVVLGGKAAGIGGTILQPLVSILFSVLIGIFCAVCLLAAASKVKEKGTIIVLIFGALFVCFGFAQLLHLNELLSTMVLGCCVVNLTKDREKFFVSIRDYFEEIIFIIFFVLAGAHLKPAVLLNSMWIVLAFVVLRTSGKVLGAYAGSKISNAPLNVKKYTALGLIPQGGIVVGLALLVRHEPAFSGISILLLNIILGTTVFHEFIGPLLTEIALKKAKETYKEKAPLIPVPIKKSSFSFTFNFFLRRREKLQKTQKF